MYIEQSVYFRQPSAFSHDHQLTINNCTNISNCTDHLSINTTVTFHELHGPFALYWILLINIATVLLLIPILDRVIYPFWYLWIPNMFNRIGSGLVASFTGIMCALAAEAVRISSSMSALQINSFLDKNVFSVDISVWVLAPQFLIQALAECLVYITSKLFSVQCYTLCYTCLQYLLHNIIIDVYHTQFFKLHAFFTPLKVVAIKYHI